jgi:hypothetical protein
MASMQDDNDRAAALTRTMASLALAAATTFPLVALAQSPAPKPTPAIKNTQSGIHQAAAKQKTAQIKTKKSNNRVATGGAHGDSEVPNNTGETSSKPGSGPGYAGGTVSNAANPVPKSTAPPYSSTNTTMK